MKGLQGASFCRSKVSRLVDWSVSGSGRGSEHHACCHYAPLSVWRRSSSTLAHCAFACMTCRRVCMELRSCLSQASGVLRRQQHGLAPSGGRALLLCTCISMQAGLNDTADGKMLMLPYSANLGMSLKVCGLCVGRQLAHSGQHLCTHLLLSRSIVTRT